MELAIGIPVGTDGKDAALYRLNGDRAEKVEAEKLSKTLKTTVDSLGYFAVIGKNDESVVPDLPVDPQTIKLNKEKVTCVCKEVVPCLKRNRNKKSVKKSLPCWFGSWRSWVPAKGCSHCPCCFLLCPPPSM